MSTNLTQLTQLAKITPIKPLTQSAPPVIPGGLSVFDFLWLLTPEAELMLLRDAAKGMQMKVLRELEKAHFYEIEDHFSDTGHFSAEPTTCNVHEEQSLATLAHVIRGDRGKSYSLNSRSDAFMAFYQERVSDYIDSYSDAQIDFGRDSPESLEKAESYDNARRKFHATLGALLAGAAALDHVTVVDLICRTCPKEVFTKAFWVSGALLINQDEDKLLMHSPAVIAMSFDAQDSLRVMQRHGLKFTEILGAQRGHAGAPRSRGGCFTPLSHDDQLDFTRFFCDADLDLSPEMLKWALIQIGAENQAGLVPEADRKLLALRLNVLGKSLLDRSSGKDLSLEHIQAGIDGGLYDFHPNASFLEAAREGSALVLEHLKDKVDWSAFEMENSPIEALLRHSEFDEYPEEFGPLATSVMGWAAQAGARQLFEPVFRPVHNTVDIFCPLIECVQKNLDQAFLTCLEMGCDPQLENEDGQTALEIAENEGLDHLINIHRSHQARQAAEHAVHEMHEIQGAWSAASEDPPTAKTPVLRPSAL